MFNIFIQHTVCYLGLVSDLSIQICSVPPGSTLWPAGSPGWAEPPWQSALTENSPAVAVADSLDYPLIMSEPERNQWLHQVHKQHIIISMDEPISYHLIMLS